MQTITTINDPPNIPAVYAMYGGRRQYVAYMGVADRLQARIEQHLVRRDSRVANGTSAVMEDALEQIAALERRISNE